MGSSVVEKKFLSRVKATSRKFNLLHIAFILHIQKKLNNIVW